MSSAIKSLLLVLAAVPLVIFLGTSIGNEEYLVPSVVCTFIFGCLIVSTVFRGFRPECLVLGFLLVGYIVGNRGFAQLSIVQPLFVGEIGLAMTLLALTGRYVVAREPLDVGGRLGKLLLLFMGFAFVRFTFDARTYQLDAARDLALAYYGLFFFVALRIAREESARRFLQKTLTVAFVLQATVTLLVLFRPQLLESIVIRGVPLFVQKGDLAATFSAAGVFYVYFQPHVFGLRWLRRALLILLFTAVTTSIARAALVGFALACLLPWLARRRGFFVYPGVLALMALSIFVLSKVIPDLDQDDRLIEVEDKIASIVDFSNTHVYRSDLGEIKGANNDFRRYLWASIFEETNADNPLLGKGFGYDFIKQFEQTYNRGAWEGLRSAHNYFVTVYGRMGLLGFLLLLGINYYLVRGGLGAAAGVHRGELGTQPLAYWCCAWTIFVAGLFGVVMEGPVGAIPFWSLLGLAVATGVAPEDGEILPVEVLNYTETKARETTPALAAR